MKIAILLLALYFFPFNVWATLQLNLKKNIGHSTFLAMGNPSAIRIEGKGDGPEGQLSLTEQADQMLISGELKVNMKSYDTGIGLRDRHMKQRYLEVEKFDTATLEFDKLSVPKSALQAGDGATVSKKWPFSGLLNLHGVKKPVQGEFSLKNQNGKTLIEASFKLRLTDYGIQVPNFAGITVADQVEVTAQTESEKFQ